MKKPSIDKMAREIKAGLRRKAKPSEHTQYDFEAPARKKERAKAARKAAQRPDRGKPDYVPDWIANHDNERARRHLAAPLEVYVGLTGTEEK